MSMTRRMALCENTAANWRNLVKPRGRRGMYGPAPDG